MLRVIPTETRHLDMLPTAEIQGFGTVNFSEMALKAYGEHLDEWSITLIEDDTIIAIMALVPTGPRLAEAWTVITEDARKHPVFLVRTARRWIEKAFVLKDLNAMQALTEKKAYLDDWMDALKFTEIGERQIGEMVLKLWERRHDG